MARQVETQARISLERVRRDPPRTARWRGLRGCGVAVAALARRARRSPRCGPTLSQRALPRALPQLSRRPMEQSPIGPMASSIGVVARMATELVSNGVGPNTSVHLALTNCPTFIAVWIATVRLGGWIVPSDPMGRAAEFEDHHRCAPDLWSGFCARDRLDAYRQAAGDMAGVRYRRGRCSHRGGCPTSSSTNGRVLAIGDTAAVMFTSGTTGRPKGVVITQANYAFAGKTMAEAAGLGADDRQLVVLPLFHANAQYYSFASAIWAGASVALMHTFSATQVLRRRPLATRPRAPVSFAAPLRMILARGAPVDGLRLRHCWFAQNISDGAVRHGRAIGLAAVRDSCTA